MYTIKRAAELTGISVATLRAWERRYAVVTPARSDGGYRLYDAADVRALAIMNSLVNEGWSARQAAQETLARLSNDEPESERGRPMAPVVPLAVGPVDPPRRRPAAPPRTSRPSSRGPSASTRPPSPTSSTPASPPPATRPSSTTG